jgi:hypothetical protein
MGVFKTQNKRKNTNERRWKKKEKYIAAIRDR